MEMNQVIKQYDQAHESARRLRNVIDALGKSQAEIPLPLDVRADSLNWNGNNRDDGYAEIRAFADGRVGFVVYNLQNRPAFVGTATNDSEITRTAGEFADALQKWCGTSTGNGTVDGSANKRR